MFSGLEHCKNIYKYQKHDTYMSKLLCKVKGQQDILLTLPSSLPQLKKIESLSKDHKK